MITFQVTLEKTHYPILIGDNLLQDQELWRGLVQGRAFCIITDDTVAPFYLPLLTETLSATKRDQFIVKAGEVHKNLTTLTDILTYLTDRHFPRDGLIIALGGGVIGDMAGFAAGIYQRGTDFIQVPTTTLAMLDSSIGGKTAVNLGAAKNNIGAFHQPKAAVMDLGVLKSLPKREFNAGLAEAVKHALIQDEPFFTWIAAHADRIMQQDSKTLSDLIQRSCAIKARIVAADERETNLRMLLNFGHTFGHAIEAYSNYQDFKHGEAIAIGLILALGWSHQKGFLKEIALIKQTCDLLEKFALPTRLPQHYSAQRLMELMQHDKKKRSGQLNLVLLSVPGQVFVHQETALAELQHYLKEASS